MGSASLAPGSGGGTGRSRMFYRSRCGLMARSSSPSCVSNKGKQTNSHSHEGVASDTYHSPGRGGVVTIEPLDCIRVCCGHSRWRRGRGGSSSGGGRCWTALLGRHGRRIAPRKYVHRRGPVRRWSAPRCARSIVIVRTVVCCQPWPA